MNKWNIDEFVEVLNKEVPLNSMNEEISLDKRRSTEWTKRMVRTYFSTAELSPAIKEGKQRFYNNQHLEEFRKLIELQYSGVPYKTATSVLKSSCGDNDLLFNSYHNKDCIEAASNFINISGSADVCSSNSFAKQETNEPYNKTKENALALLSVMRSSNIKKSELENKNNIWVKFSIKEGVEINIREDIFKDKNFIKEIQEWINKQ